MPWCPIARALFLFDKQLMRYTIGFMDISPPRFKTIDDGLLFMECVRDKKPFPRPLWVHPFKMNGNICMENPEYKNAQYEARYVFEAKEKTCRIEIQGVVVS